jgi:alpha-2-macroglobulin
MAKPFLSYIFPRPAVVLALICGLLLTSCSSNEIRITDRNFDEEIPQNQTLSFVFNENIVSESELGEWQATQFLDISPEVPGWFKWVSRNELLFSPTQGFAAATEYKIRLNDNLLPKTTENWSLSGQTFICHTPYLHVDQVEAFWDKADDGQRLAKMNVRFNYAINASEVANKLKVRAGDQNLTYRVQQTGQTSTLTLAIQGANTEADNRMQLVLDEGLGLPNSDYKTTEEQTFKTAMPDANTLEVADVTTGFENNQGFIRVTTTQELKPEQLQAYFTVTRIGGARKADEKEEVAEVADSVSTSRATSQTPQSDFVDTRAELTNNGLIIRGNFNETDSYLLTLQTRTEGVLGSSLAEVYTKDLYFGKMPAAVEFSHRKAQYLSTKGNRNVALNIVNVPKVNVQISKIYENNLLQYLHNFRYENYDFEGDEEGSNNTRTYNYSTDDQGVLSDILVKKTIETDVLPVRKGVSLLNLPMPDQGNQRGVFLVNVNSEDDYYLNATKLVSVSDIGLITKNTSDEIWVFASGIYEAESLSGVEIKLISSNNQVMQIAKTNSAGVAVFRNLKSTQFKPALITAVYENDFNYLLLEDSQVATSRFEVEGARDNPTGFEAFVYGDRNIYRPGETMFFNTIIRKNNWESAGEIPLKINVLLPNGKEFWSAKVKTNSQGAVAQKVSLPRAAVTGTYVLEVKNGNGALLTSQSVAVEEFMPDRIKVDVKTGQELYRNGQEVQVVGLATNLFGPPAAGRNYEMSLQLSRKRFQPKGYEGFVFDINDNTTFEEVLRQGQTNDQGQATERFPLPVTYTDMGLLEGKCYVTVFDETGRPVNRLKRFEVQTQPVFFGIGMPDTYLSTNVPVEIPLLALGKDGNPLSSQAQVEVIRFEYQTIIEKNYDNSLQYSSKKQSKMVYSRLVNLGSGRGSIRYAPNVSGEYEVRVHRLGARSWTSQRFYAYGYGATQNSSFEVNNEGQVTMTFDKEKYQVGDRAKVLFKTPFAGKLLVSIERNKVLEHHVIDTDKKSAEWSFKIGQEHLPNIYVSATLFRPMREESLPLTVAHGYAPVMVEDADKRLTVDIMAVERSRSKTKQKIRIKTKANSQVTIAVVDEGILQLKNFKTPDPFGFFYQKRALEVNSHDVYPFLLPELSINSRSTTGGDGYDLEKRINPLANGRVNLVAFWSGIIETGFDGEAEFEVDIPQFSGDLRIMAVAYKGDSFGSTNKNMKVADPLVLSTALPRFASPNDELIVPLSITNTTRQSAQVTAQISVKGSLMALNASPQTLTIGPEKEGRATFNLRALPSMGLGEVVMTVKGLKETFVEKIELPVRPSTSLLKVATSGMINGGQTVAVNLPNDFVSSTFRGSMLLSKTPVAQFASQFDNLLGYPHGCVEQVVSRAFPQLYLGDMAKQLLSAKKPYMKAGESDLNPNTNVQAAIGQLANRQLYSGGLSYWQAGSEEYWWGTAYAGHFLVEAKKAGFEINEQFWGKLMGYLQAKVGVQALETEISYNPDGSVVNRNIVKREIIYSLYVLALQGSPNRAVMNYYKANPNLLTTDERYLLAGAFASVGETASFKALLPKTYTAERFDRQMDGSLASPIRNNALILNTLLDTDPDNLQIPALARQLSEAVKAQAWLSTQEQAFALLAFGKLSKKANQSNITANVSSGGRALGKFQGDPLWLKNIGASNQIATTGRGTLYYFAQAEGLSAQGKFEEIDQVLQVRKTFYTRTGQPLTAANFKQNQLVVVKITLQSTNGLPVPNVVLTDMLPAGLEIENPRLNEDRSLAWIKDQSAPTHFDIRDDRINYFTSASDQPKAFYYLVRAVSKGRFVIGPVAADAMYNGEYRSYSGGGTCVIE